MQASESVLYSLQHSKTCRRRTSRPGRSCCSPTPGSHPQLVAELQRISKLLDPDPHRMQTFRLVDTSGVLDRLTQLHRPPPTAASHVSQERLHRLTRLRRSHCLQGARPPGADVTLPQSLPRVDEPPLPLSANFTHHPGDGLRRHPCGFRTLGQRRQHHVDLAKRTERTRDTPRRLRQRPPTLVASHDRQRLA